MILYYKKKRRRRSETDDLLIDIIERKTQSETWSFVFINTSFASNTSSYKSANNSSDDFLNANILRNQNRFHLQFHTCPIHANRLYRDNNDQYYDLIAMATMVRIVPLQLNEQLVSK